TAGDHLLALAIRFGMVGIVKTGLDFATFNVLLLVIAESGRREVLLANTAGFTVALAASFVLNARYTFRVQARRGRFLQYLGVSLAGLLIYNGTLAAVLTVWQTETTLEVNAAKAASLASSMVWNFVGYRYLVFRPPSRPQR